jgi:anti-anti-sigma factor
MKMYSINVSSDTVTVTLSDRLDFSNAPGLMEDLKSFVGQPIQKVIFDCRELKIISSAGLRVLIFAKQKIAVGGEVVVAGAPDTVTRVISMSGFDSFLVIRDSLEIP